MAEDGAFVILGALNASAVESDGTGNPMALLLENPLVQGEFKSQSKGGPGNTLENPYADYHTAEWKSRADYVLPSTAGLKIEQGAVFWSEQV